MDSQHQSTKGNARQREMPWLADYPRPIELDWRLVSTCERFTDAISLAIARSRVRRTDSALCDHLGIDKGQFSRIRNGSAHFPNELYLRFCYVVGNWGIYQYRELERQRMQSPGLACALDEDVA